mmetsp:Transcript_509/g.1052  ORF Transcript_509/g.1052 Transcript_509/m.1052 type:complete len:80 (+) Transcript_509:2532-2771(+)
MLLREHETSKIPNSGVCLHSTIHILEERHAIGVVYRDKRNKPYLSNLRIRASNVRLSKGAQQLRKAHESFRREKDAQGN